MTSPIGSSSGPAALSAPAIPPDLLAGRYRVERELGAGGMATVYLAEDLPHRRRVALKVLRPELAAVVGAERFLKEIEITAGLQHPHILPLHDSGLVGGTAFYVMPFVEGETLRARLTRERQLPVEDALRVAREVAAALDYAHRQGVIHRDVKPENILLHDGSALVADFGIALAAAGGAPGRLTETGMSLGTPHYMSPEQATGERTLDARADVYALGCVLYELLAGEPPFTGPNAQAIVARVITGTPEPLAVRRPTTPPHVDAAVRRALEKLPADRFPSAAAFAEALGNPATAWPPAAGGGTAGRLTGRASRGSRLVTGVAVMTALVAAGVAAWAVRGWRAARDDRPVVRFDIPLGVGVQVTRLLAVAPDGRTIAFLAESASVRRLYVRPLDAPGVRAVPAEGLMAMGLAFSPDSRWLAFVADGKLKKLPVAGGTPTTLAEVGVASGVAWPRADAIVVGPRISRGAGLRIVPAAGGTPRELTRAAGGPRGVRHLWPQSLPDGRSVVFVSTGPGGNEDDFLAVASIETGEVTTFGITGAPLGVVGDRLVYRSYGDRGLLAVPFDVARRRVAGEPVAVAERVDAAAVSAAGVLVTVRGRSASRVEWVRADGTGGAPLIERPGDYQDPRLSPDGRRLAIGLVGQSGPEVWIHDLASGTLSRLTAHGHRPEWTPDGTRVVYHDVASGTGLAWLPADLTGAAEPLARGSQLTDRAIEEGVVSPDRRTLLYVIRGDLYTVPVGGAAPPATFLASPANNRMPRFSPDGRWVAYQSPVSGRDEVYVTPWPGPGPRYPVSAAGGTEPVWSRDGRRLFYREGRKMLAATVSLTGGFTVTARATLFEGDFLADPGHPQYDVAADGRFVMLRATGEPTRISVVLNWPRELAPGR